MCNEGTIRDWIRHGKFNVTQGKNFDATGSIGPWIETDSRPDQAAAPHRAQERRSHAGRHHGEHDLLVRRSHRLRHDVHDAQAGRHHLTGTPVKKGPKTEPPVWLKPGDTIEIECPEIGVLRNSVADEA